MQDEKKTKKELIQELIELRKHVKKLEAKEAPKKKAKGITKEMKSQEAMSVAKKQLEEMINTVDGIVWEGDPDSFRFIFVSKKAEKMLGYPVERWLNEPTFWIDHLHDDDRKWAPDFCAKMTREMKDHEFEYRMISADGRVVWLRDIVTVIAENKKPVKARGIIVDITERKRVEEEVRILHKQMEFILGATKTGLDIIDSDFNVRFMDSEWQKVYGDPTGRKCYEYFMGRSEKCPGCGIPKALETKMVTVTETIMVKEGNRPVQVTTIPFQNDKGEWLFAQVKVDITERKMAEKARILSETNLKAFINNRDESIWSLDNNYNLIICNDYFRNAFLAAYNVELKTGINLIDILSPELRAFWKPKYDAVLSGEKISFEFKETIQGNLFYFNVSLNPIISEGKITWVSALSVDVTEQKHMEELLKEREERYRELFNGVTDAIYLHYVSPEKPGKFIAVNEAACRMLGYTKNEFMQMEVKHINVPEQTEKIPAILEKLFRDGYNLFETEHVAKDGRRIPVEINIRLFDFQGNPSVLSVVRDITERKQADEALQLSHERLAEVQGIAKIGNWKADLFTGELYWSQAIFDIFGFESKSFKPSVEAFYESVHPDDRELVLESEKRSEQTGVHDVVHRIIRPNGEVRVVHELAKRYTDAKGKLVMLRGTVQDITERKRAEEKLHESEERYRQIVELSPDTIFIQTEGKIAFINAAGLKLFGTANTEQLVGKKVLDLMHPDYREIVKERIRMLNIEGKEVPILEQKYLRLDGTSVDVEVTAKPITHFGKPGAQVMVRDITARKQAEVAMERLRSQNELILNSAGEGILGLDLEGKHTFVNPSAARMLGYEVEELLGQRSHAVWHYSKADGSPYPEDECPIYAAYKDGKIHHINEDVFWRKDGKSFPIDYTSTPIMENGKIVGAVVTFSDISERKKSEDALRASEEKFRSLVSSSSEHIFIIGKDGRYLLSNGRIGQFGNIQGGSIIGLDISDVYPQDTAGFYKEQVDHVFSTGEKLDFEHTLSEPDGLHYHFDTLFPIEREGDIWGVGGICRDITELKKAAEEKEALSVISQLFLTRDNPKDIYNELPWILSERFKFPIVTMELYDQGKGTLRLVGSIGAEYSEESEPFSLPIEQSIAGKAVLTGKPFYDLNADKLSEDQLGILGGMRIRTIICIPILGKNVTFGAITLADTRQRRRFIASVKTLQVIANHMAQELERLQAREAISKAKEEWEHTFDAVPDLVCILDKEFRIVRINLAMAKKLGMQPADCIGKTCYEVVHGAETPPDFCPHAQLLHDGEEHTVEIYEERLGGYFIITTSPIYDEKGQLIGGVHMARDITERKLIENQIKSSLSEKEILLREIHHRVKNNIQIISSLMKLSSDTIKDQSILDIFTESQNRIKSMALIHEKLYQSSDLARIDFSEYIESLSHELYRAYGIDPDRITMRLSMESIPLGIDKAIPCGLIVNELITNALKHAFPEETEGEIIISLADKGKGVIELIISDNGIGVPPSIDLSTTKTLGLYIVHILAEDQLEGSVTLDRTKGTAFKITFSRKDEKSKLIE